MAHVETWWRCPGCHRKHDTQKKAEKCAVTHVHSEQWAVGGGGKAVLVAYRGLEWALREADLSDFIEERKRQLAEE
jgi:hypothetical protein